MKNEKGKVGREGPVDEHGGSRFGIRKKEQFPVRGGGWRIGFPSGGDRE